MKRLLFLVGLFLTFVTPDLAQTKTDTIWLESSIDMWGDYQHCFFRGADSTEIECFIFQHDTISEHFKYQCAPGVRYDRRITANVKVKMAIYTTNAPHDIHIGYYANDTIADIVIGGSCIVSLDVSGCTSLTSLDCSGNNNLEIGLRSLDVSGCTSLTSLDCSNNKLTSLDVSKNTSLTSLDMSKNTSLTSLDCNDNALTSLDMSKNTSLTSLDCNDNALTSLDVSKNTSLTSLDCNNNALTSLDASGCTSLTSLDCRWNHIPLSNLYKGVMQSYDGKYWKVSDQSDSIILLLNQLWDLSTERIIGQIITDFELTDAYGREVSSDFWTENRFVFQFYEPLKYTLKLQNPNVADTFTWHISVLDELPDNYFTVQVASNNATWGTAVVTGNGIYEGGGTVTVTANAKAGCRFVNWTKKDGTVFGTEAVHTFTVTENLELTANFEKIPDDVTNESRQDENFTVYVQDRTICLSENWGTVQVFNTLGQCIYIGANTRIPVRQSGVYIVRVGARSYKVVVR